MIVGDDLLNHKKNDEFLNLFTDATVSIFLGHIYISTFARILYLKPLKEMYNSQSANFHHLLSIFKFLNIN